MYCANDMVFFFQIVSILEITEWELKIPSVLKTVSREKTSYVLGWPNWFGSAPALFGTRWIFGPQCDVLHWLLFLSRWNHVRVVLLSASERPSPPDLSHSMSHHLTTEVCWPLMAGACRVGLIALRAKLIRDPEKKSAMHTKVGHFFENSGTLAMVFR